MFKDVMLTLKKAHLEYKNDHSMPKIEIFKKVEFEVIKIL